MGLPYASDSQNLSADERLWRATNANLTALQDIVSAHFRLPCRHYAPMGNFGIYARVFLFTLENDQQVVGRVLLPVRETVKTEAEVASMILVRGIIYHDLLRNHLNHFSPSSHPHTCPAGLPLLQHATQSSRS
jgi:hypothetical protein